VKFNSSVALRAGLIGAAAGLVVALLGRIPFVACIVGPLGWLVAVGTGVLYVYFIINQGGSVDVAGGAVGGAVSGAIAGAAQSLVSGILTLVFGTVRAASTFLQGEPGAGALAAGATVIGVIAGIVLGTIISAALGALGGVVFAAIQGQKSS